MSIFVGLTKRNVVKKVLNYWYKNCSDQYTLKEFLRQCTIKKEDCEFVVKYHGIKQ